MAIKRKGVVAVPGEYSIDGHIEKKTAEELKLAAERQPIIMLTKGHPVDGIPTAKEVIGTLSQKWDATNEKVVGEFWFHDEKIPDTIKKKLDNFEPIPISAGYVIDDIDDDGYQKGIVYTHMAVLDGEDPVCPLNTCGVNVRTESMPNRLMRFEQKSELEVPEQEQVIEEVKELEVVEPVVEPETETPAEQKPEVEVEEPVEEEVELVPEVVIPVGVPVRKEYEVDASGWITFIPRKYKEK